MKSLLKASFVVLLCAASSFTAKAQSVVYDNITGDTGIQYTAPSGTEFGNQIVLGGEARFVTGFVLAYWGQGFAAGGATADVRFYKNDGTVDSQGFNPKPGTLLYDSGSFAINPTAGKSMVFDQAALNGGVWVTDSFTWTVSFTTPTGSAGVNVFNGGAVGKTVDAFWYNGNAGWDLRVDPQGAPTSFAAQVTAVPEPATCVLFGFGGLACMSFIRRQARR